MPLPRNTIPALAAGAAGPGEKSRRGEKDGRGNPGGVLPLGEALTLHESIHGNRDVVLFCRVSAPAQVSAGRLKDQELSECRAHEEAGCDVIIVSCDQHSGRMDDPRHIEHLRRAFGYARKRRAFVSARDVSRYARPGDFAHDDSEGWRRQATPDDLARLLRLASGVIVASRIDPALPAAEAHSLVTKAGRKPGRPRAINHQKAIQILEQLGPPSHRGGRTEWDMPLGQVAKLFKVKKAAVQRLVESLVPERACGRAGLRWMDCSDPARAYRTAYKSGHLSDDA